MTAQAIQLTVCNVAILPDEAMRLLLAVTRRGLIGPDRTLQRRFLTPAFHFTDRGRLRVLQDVVEAWLSTCQDRMAPTVAEFERLLATAPEVAKAYEVHVEGQTWTLRARAPRRPLRRTDWSRAGWHFVFPVGPRRHFFSVTGPEFLPFSRMFQHLGGSHTARQLGAMFPQHRPLLRRFLAFARRHGLLTAPRRVQAQPPGVEFISHSSIQFTGRRASIMIDPCFVLSGLLAASERDRRRFDAKFAALDQVSAVLLTHAHWDHAHLPTLLRFRRDVPIFVPKVTEESYYNPGLARLLRSLGFSDVREVAFWQPEQIGDITFTPVPFFGEWFGPGSHFDAFCYLVEVDGVRYLGTVDAERSEGGNMDSVFAELRQRVGQVDCMFFCSSGQTHANPVLCGAPAQYSNGFDVHADLMRYHPDAEAVVRWSRMLQPRVVVPYAEFIFSAMPRRAAVGLDQVDWNHHFDDYWRKVEASGAVVDDGVYAWKRTLETLRTRLPRPTRLLMMSPGEALRA